MFLVPGGDLDYDKIGDSIRVEMDAVRDKLRNNTEALKSDKNSVTLHKERVRLTLELKKLAGDSRMVKDGKRLNLELIKRNQKLDQEKIKLLELKRRSEELNSNILKTRRNK